MELNFCNASLGVQANKLISASVIILKLTKVVISSSRHKEKKNAEHTYVI